MIHIYTDGSCIGNPGPGGWAAIILTSPKSSKPEQVLKGRSKDTTNNRMEMTAVIEGLRYIHENHLQAHTITVFTDSNLVVQTLNQGWKRKKNIDLWEELDELNEELDVTYQWVKGHSTNKWNNECDKVALSEATKAAKSRK